MSAEEQPQSCCPMMDLVREHFPIVPLVVPILFPLLPMVCIIMYLARLTDALEQVEDGLEDIHNTVKRLG